MRPTLNFSNFISFLNMKILFFFKLKYVAPLFTILFINTCIWFLKQIKSSIENIIGFLAKPNSSNGRVLAAKLLSQHNRHNTGKIGKRLVFSEWNSFRWPCDQFIQHLFNHSWLFVYYYKGWKLWNRYARPEVFHISSVL